MYTHRHIAHVSIGLHVTMTINIILLLINTSSECSAGSTITAIGGVPSSG